MRKFLPIFCLLVCAAFRLEGQKFYAKPADLESLSNGTVYAITQDSKGAVWLGTSYGLCRYNGIELQNVSKLITVHPFATSRNKDVFFCHCENGILKVDALSCRTSFICTDQFPSGINSIAVNGESLIACDNSAIYVEDGDSLRTWMKIPRKHGKPRLLRYTPSGRLFLTTSTGNLFEIIEDNLFPRACLQDEISELYEDRNYKLWVGLESMGIRVFSHDFLKRTDIHPEDARKPARKFRAFMEDFEGNVFAGGLDGLYFISADGKCRPETSYTPDGFAICSLFRDEGQNIWIGTFYGGAFLCGKNVSPFSRIESFYSSQPRISTGLIEDKRGDMWLVTDRSGMYRFPKDGSAAKYIPGSANYKMKNAWYDSERDAIWISLYLQPFVRYDIKTGRWTKYDYTSSNGKTLTVSGFHIARVGEDFWIAGSAAIYLFNENKESTISRVLPDFNKHPRNIRPVSDGSVLICSNGLFRWKDGTVRKLSDLEGSLCFDVLQNGDILWVGTNSGLFQCDTSGKTLRHFDKSNVGLEDNNVYSILPLQGERFLLGTNGGVSILDTEKAECFNYSTRNGLSLSSVQEGNITRRSDGSVWIAGTDGIAHFNPSDHRFPKSHPGIRIDKLTAGNRTIDLSEGKPLRFSHKENNIFIQSSDFDFAGIVPTFSQCRLLPHEKEWKPFNIKSPISFIGLKSGNYTVELRTVNSLISCNTCSSTSLKFRIRYPWYWSPAAWVIYLVLLALYARWQVEIISESRARKRVKNAKDVSIVAQNDSDTDFIREAEKVILNHLSEPNFSVETLCQETGLNYKNFSSKIKSLTGYVPRDFIEIIRMKKASELLLDKRMNISSVAFDVGFNSSQYFATRFKKHFGLTPSEYISKHEG